MHEQTNQRHVLATVRMARLLVISGQSRCFAKFNVKGLFCEPLGHGLFVVLIYPWLMSFE